MSDFRNFQERARQEQLSSHRPVEVIKVQVPIDARNRVPTSPPVHQYRKYPQDSNNQADIQSEDDYSLQTSSAQAGTPSRLGHHHQQQQYSAPIMEEIPEEYITEEVVYVEEPARQAPTPSPVDNDTKFTKTFPLEWEGLYEHLTSGSVTAILNKDALRKLLTPEIINPDKANRERNAFEITDAHLDLIHISKLTARAVCNTLPLTVHICAGEGEKGANLKHLNVNFMNRTSNCMLPVAPNANAILGGDFGLKIIDNAKVLDSNVFKCVGHTTLEKLEKDLTFPNDYDPDQRITLKSSSPIWSMIEGNRHRLESMDAETAGQIQDLGHAKLVPYTVIVEVLRKYEQQIEPLMKSNVTASQDWVFHLKVDVDKAKHYTSLRGVRCTVLVNLEMEYCFPHTGIETVKQQEKRHQISARQLFKREFGTRV